MTRYLITLSITLGVEAGDRSTAKKLVEDLLSNVKLQTRPVIVSCEKQKMKIKPRDPDED